MDPETECKRPSTISSVLEESAQHGGWLNFCLEASGRSEPSGSSVPLPRLASSRTRCLSFCIRESVFDLPEWRHSRVLRKLMFEEHLFCVSHRAGVLHVRSLR